MPPVSRTSGAAASPKCSTPSMTPSASTVVIKIPAVEMTPPDVRNEWIIGYIGEPPVAQGRRHKLRVPVGRIGRIERPRLSLTLRDGRLAGQKLIEPQTATEP